MRPYGCCQLRVCLTSSLLEVRVQWRDGPARVRSPLVQQLRQGLGRTSNSKCFIPSCSVLPPPLCTTKFGCHYTIRLWCVPQRLSLAGRLQAPAVLGPSNGQGVDMFPWMKHAVASWLSCPYLFVFGRSQGQHQILRGGFISKSPPLHSLLSLLYLLLFPFS